MNSLLKQRNTKSERFPCGNTSNHTTLWHKEKISPMSLDKPLSFLNLAFFWNLTDFILHTGNEKGLYLLRSATSAPTLMCEEFLDRKRWDEEGAWLDHQVSPLVGHGWLLFGPTVSLQWHCSIIFSIIAASLQHHCSIIHLSAFCLAMAGNLGVVPPLVFQLAVVDASTWGQVRVR